jgi:S-adenosylmethionine/arginine decarboxylase-like enzyme
MECNQAVLPSLRPTINHYIVEIFELDIGYYPDVNLIEKLITEFASRISLSIVKHLVYEYKPHGFTIVYILSSSHIVVHSWPENRYMNLDIMRCDLPQETQYTDTLLRIAIDLFGSKRVTVTQVVYNQDIEL